MFPFHKPLVVLSKALLLEFDVCVAYVSKRRFGFLFTPQKVLSYVDLN